MYKKMRAYLAKHHDYNSFIHVLAGVGVGILITYPLVGSHPVRWGLLFLALGIFGHFYPVLANKK